jgi:hypothetical protein
MIGRESPSWGLAWNVSLHRKDGFGSSLYIEQAAGMLLIQVKSERVRGEQKGLRVLSKTPRVCDVRWEFSFCSPQLTLKVSHSRDGTQ